jgi:hypothetical protein
MKNTHLRAIKMAFLFTMFGYTASMNTQQAHAQISNGSFETPAITANTTLIVPNAGTVGAWNVVSGGTNEIRLANGNITGVVADSGVQFMTFNGSDKTPGGSLSQNFTTTPGQPYTVGFSIGRLGPGAGSISIRGDVFNDPSGSNTQIATLTGAGATSGGTYLPYTFNFTATGTLTQLRFTDTSAATTSVDVVLDTVSVTAAPEPGTLALLAIGGTGLVSRLRRRKR